MAQLVDGRADSFAHEYCAVFNLHTGQIQEHPDWSSLSPDETRFVWKVFALLLFQSASSFTRRVVDPLHSLPYIILSMGRTRHDLPDEKRKHIAQMVLGTPLGQLDINTLKVRKMFQQDLELASRTGKLGVALFAAIKTMRRLWKAEVRENERLNKQLKLFGERAPNSSLDLITARLSLKFRLGTAGLRQEELESSRPRNWARVRSMAANVFDTCLNHWMEAQSEVLSEERRFEDPGVPDWTPSKEETHSWMSVLQPSKSEENAATRILAGLINRSLYRFLQGKNTTKTQNPSEFPEPYFSAIAFVKDPDDRLQKGRPYRLSSPSEVYLFAELVNRSVRLLRASWTGSRILPIQPWRFVWAAELVTEASKQLKVIAFPVMWVLSDDGALQGSCVSKSGDVSLVTITFFEEVSWI